MPIAPRATIKSYFETGKKPTQAQFAEQVDVIYDIGAQANDNADAAVATANATAAASVKGHGFFKLTKPAGVYAMDAMTVYRDEACTIAAVQSDPFGDVWLIVVTVTLADANADAFYHVDFNSRALTGAGGSIGLTSRMAGNFVFTINLPKTGANILTDSGSAEYGFNFFP